MRIQHWYNVNGPLERNRSLGLALLQAVPSTVNKGWLAVIPPVPGEGSEKQQVSPHTAQWLCDSEAEAHGGPCEPCVHELRNGGQERVGRSQGSC